MRNAECGINGNVTVRAFVGAAHSASRAPHSAFLFVVIISAVLLCSGCPSKDIPDPAPILPTSPPTLPWPIPPPEQPS